MFNKKNIHLVPQIIQDRAAFMLKELNERSALIDETAQDNCAQQLETIRDFCIESLGKYEKKRKKVSA